MIGAGAAGIAAARRIQAANRKVIVVEASSRIGGRCMTDADSFDVPVRSRRALAAHARNQSAVVKLAAAGAGIDVAPSPPSQKLRIGRRNARAGETEELLAAVVRANRAIDEAARRADISCACGAAEGPGDWAGTIDFVLGAYVDRQGPERSLDAGSFRARRIAPSMLRHAARGSGALMGKLGEAVSGGTVDACDARRLERTRHRR